MRRSTLWLPCVLFLAFVPLLALSALGGSSGTANAQPNGDWVIYLPNVVVMPPPTPTEIPIPAEILDPTSTLTPEVTPSPTATAPTIPLEWDPRLDQRFAVLIPAAVGPGQGFWRVIQGTWYDVNDFHPFGVGDHEIHYDVQDPTGARQVGKTMQITWMTDGACENGRVPAEGLAPYQAHVECAVHTQTESKRGELYAGAWGMNHVAPTYKIIVDDGNPSDAVNGLGMGSIQQPGMKIHTACGFIWRWTIAPSVDPTPGVTPGGMPTLTSTVPPTPPTTVTPAVTVKPTSTTPPTPEREWDARLTQRGAILTPAIVTEGQGYWRLVEGQWYDINEPPFNGLGLIMVDTVDQEGNRQTGVQIQISNLAGAPLTTITTDRKPGELYAGNTYMSQPAPAYRARPLPLNVPADSVSGMGLGNLTGSNPWAATRYGLVWKWTIAGAEVPTAMATSTATPAALPGNYLFNTAVMAACLPQAAGTWFDGIVTLNGEPANGYRVTFSDTPDGPWISEQPAITGPTSTKPWDDPGHYAHIIRPAASGSPIAGDWYVWVVDANGNRISAIAQWHSTGRGTEGEGCNDATVNFGS